LRCSGSWNGSATISPSTAICVTHDIGRLRLSDRVLVIEERPPRTTSTSIPVVRAVALGRTWRAGWLVS